MRNIPLTLTLLPHPIVVSAAEMREIEAEEARCGNTSEILMERAGKQVAEKAIEWIGPKSSPRVLVFAGPGNNGGDALVVARVLDEHGWPVRCLTWSRVAALDGRLQAPLRESNISVESVRLDSLDEALEWATVIVDGLLGMGITRDVAGELAEIVGRVSSVDRPIISIDIPTGVDSDTGAVRGVALVCDFTVALGLLKYGHVLEPGKTLSGQIKLGDIGLDNQLSRGKASGELLTDKAVRALLPERSNDANKGSFGKAMVVAGSINYVGAAALATEGALRSGAGLVTLGCAGDLLMILAAKLTECTFLPLPSDLGVISARAIDKLKESLDGYSSLLIGCGLGKDKETAHFLKGVLSHAEEVREMRIGFAARSVEKNAEKKEEETGLPPLVLDGDALNLLAEMDSWPDLVPQGSVLTPHPGEMARLLGSTVEQVQKDRVNVARSAAKDWKQVVVLKGASTVIAEPGGKIFISPFSNPALATGGTGDVLAGAIVGLLAQGLSPVEAACAGVYLHGLAGEMLREEYGVAGGLAGDLPVLLARAQHRLREKG